MKFWKKKSDADARKERINDGFRHVEAMSTEASEDSDSSKSAGRSRRGSVYHFEPEVILPGITQVPSDRDQRQPERMPPKKSKTWHQEKYTPRSPASRSRSRSRSSSISSRESFEIFSDRESATSSVSEYSYEYTPPRKTQSRPSSAKKPRERVVVTETFIGGKLHKRETETFTYKDSGPSSSSSMGSEGSSERYFSPNSFRERQHSQRERQGPGSYRRDAFRPPPRDDMPFGEAPFHRDFKRPPRASTMPRPDPNVRFEYRQPSFNMPPRRDTSPNDGFHPRWGNAPPRRRAPRPPRWDDPPPSYEARNRGYRRRSPSRARDSSPQPTTSPGGHYATARELPEIVTNKLEPLDEPRWATASNEALCQYIFQTFPPKTDGPKTYKEQVTGSLDRKDLLKTIARFHPDKNTEYGEEWKLTCSEIVKHLNKRLSEWK